RAQAGRSRHCRERAEASCHVGLGAHPPMLSALPVAWMGAPDACGWSALMLVISLWARPRPAPPMVMALASMSSMPSAPLRTTRVSMLLSGLAAAATRGGGGSPALG